ncbi:hypothetical protein Vafri_12436 [Volvox africanus]|uniref:Uncharacterized protein n=1 Tax=Volvox africanus TaxID=51714 RepID=A0A8J4F2F7_9CHLO|nr:hypothetical protein Vafri_12436 [Volvox africanus]
MSATKQSAKAGACGCRAVRLFSADGMAGGGVTSSACGGTSAATTHACCVQSSVSYRLSLPASATADRISSVTVIGMSAVAAAYGPAVSSCICRLEYTEADEPCGIVPTDTESTSCGCGLP